MGAGERLRAALRLGRRSPLVSRSVVAALVIAPLTLTAVAGRGNAPVELAPGNGAAWLASPQLGVVTLLDGVSREVAATVPVAPAGHRLEVTQSGPSAYVADLDS